MTVDIAGIERLTSASEKRLVTALDKATTGIAVLESRTRNANDDLRHEQFSRQQEALTAEIEHIIASKVAREKMESFEVKDIVVNKEAVVKGYNHDLATNPETLNSAKVVRDLYKKNYITLLSVPIREYKEGSERITALFARKPWVAVLKMPGSINNYHLVSPTDFKTDQQKEALKQEWVSGKAERKRLHKERIDAIRYADAEFRKQWPAIRAEQLAQEEAKRNEEAKRKAEEKTRLKALKREKQKAKRDFEIRNKEALLRKKAMKQAEKESKKKANA